MVRLKGYRINQIDNDVKYFNSTMVRLKVSAFFASLYCATKFQFHNGTIKSMAKVIFQNLPAKFQFHNGTIKSSSFCCNSTCKTNFNSTMVRLKVEANLEAWADYFYFNSTMVRLKAATYINAYSNNKFQFHNGTIKRT